VPPRAGFATQWSLGLAAAGEGQLRVLV
jgi:hypothetical protein